MWPLPFPSPSRKREGSSEVDRRSFLAGALALPLLPSTTDTRAALDEAAALPPAEALVRLAAIDTRRLATRERLDVEAARAGLAIDRDLARFGGSAKQGYRPEPGSMARLPQGADWYRLLLGRSLGTVEPRAAQARLAQAMTALQARADRGFRAIGLTRGSVADRYRALWQDERFLFADDDAGRAAAVAAMTRELDAARGRVPVQVGAVPAWAAACSVRALSPAEIAAGKNGYRIVPTPTAPGAYIVDLRAVRRRPAWTLPSVVAHELLPGHMSQLGLEGTAPPHPLRITYAAAFVEGWGIQAETVAPYADPHARLGHLHWLIFRVGRALADIGFHHDGWSADETRARLVGWQGEPAYFAPFDVELARIPREPASRAAEALAWLGIADGARRSSVAGARGYYQRLLADGRRRTEQLAG
ncbi:DUF885 family protein [Sphingomonas sp. MA1305]|uniref:DUF885 family protein n=1 Tax=Sphingomonas sp. MA1305 TaxID=2479204 RepID=UPI001E62C4AB|nr:DUF885 family protein [Sphingomonas sp. MA1305]